MAYHDNQQSCLISSSTSWRIVIHGGATDSCPDVHRQNEIKLALNHIVVQSAKLLEEGAYAQDVVAQAVTRLEDCPLFNAGNGAALTKDGDCELEAGIIDGHSGKYGAVCCVQQTKNPILAAKALADEGPHRMLVGKAADDHAKHIGLESVPNEHFVSPFRRKYWERSQETDLHKSSDTLGTVGALVLDSYGHLAAGGSTGGTPGKHKGRIGDTAVLGAGLLANKSIAIACSGAGDDILQHLVASKAAAYHESGLDLGVAARRAIRDMSISNSGSCSILAMDAEGKTSVESTARVFYTASDSSQAGSEITLQSTTCPWMVDHQVYNDARISIRLSRFPTTPGQLVARTQMSSGPADLFSLNRDDFSGIMQTIQRMASACCQVFDAQRCALVTEGDNSISVIPLHGLREEWQPITHDGERSFYQDYPGYITSKDGPSMPEPKFNEVCQQIQKISGVAQPFNYSFFGDVSDRNLFARIVRGELPQKRIWESDSHVAFLTPFANTTGFTVLVPRAHLPSDIFSLDQKDYSSLIHAAYDVAQTLKRAFRVKQIGMIFEGFEINYCHVKLIPIWGSAMTPDPVHNHSPISQADFYEEYPGFVTSQQGPVAQDAVALSKSAQRMRDLLQNKEPIAAPKSWKVPSKHTLEVLRNPWYSSLLTLQDSLYMASVTYFSTTMGYKYAFVPATTDAISSPMGLGSDSLPVDISFLGKKTRLADSMQFALEYYLRIQDGLPGAYYINNSFRGEDSDSMHLNQFYHVECELLGDFAAGMANAEKYITTLITTFLHTQSETLHTIPGSISRLQTLLTLYHSHNNSFPSITLDQALSLPTMDSTTWRHIIPHSPNSGRTITRAGELRLIAHFGGACWLTEMDHLSVPFYQAYTDASRTKARCADFLIGNGEVLGLGERHVSAAAVESALEMHKTETEPYRWYLDMREEKPLRTTGWGMGVERFLAWVMGHDDIRDLVVMPRMKGVDFSP